MTASGTSKPSSNWREFWAALAATVAIGAGLAWLAWKVVR